MSTLRPITEDDLHAYVDAQLASDRSAEVETYLAHHPEVAARIEGYRRQRDLLRTTLDPIAEEPLPARLAVRRLAEDARRPWSGRWRNIAATAAMLVFGGLGGWTLHGELSPPARGVGALAREAASSYRVYATDSVRPVELPAEERLQLVRWLSQRIGAPVSAPDLEAAGYGFVGGRLVATPHGPAAFFLYEDGEGRRLGVLTRPMEVEKDARMIEHDEFGVAGVAWADDGIGYSVVAEHAPAALRPVAQRVRRQAGGSI